MSLSRKQKFLAAAGFCAGILLLLYLISLQSAKPSSTSAPQIRVAQRQHAIQSDVNDSRDALEKSAAPIQEVEPVRGGPVEEVSIYTDEELKTLELMVINFDGTINPEFFTKFGFSPAQRDAFELVWKSMLDLLQRIESYKITPDNADHSDAGASTKFWIAEFPVEGEGLKTFSSRLKGKIPEQARKFFFEFNDYDRQYTFSDFGNYCRSYEITKTGDTYTMIETFFLQADEGLIGKGWRRHEFKVPPPRFQFFLKESGK